MSEPPTAPSDRIPPLALWRVAAAFMHTLFALFGAPEDVAASHMLTTQAYRLMLTWLRAGEAMLRRLVLIEASAFPRPNTRPILWPKRARTRRLVTFTADKPEEWRVSFRCFYGARVFRRALSRSKSGPEGPRSRFQSAWPLAERYEALLRVCNNPAPYARRLARRLHALPHRLAEILRASAGAEHRVDCFEMLTDAAHSRWRCADTS